MFEQTVDIERIEQLVGLFGNFDENIKLQTLYLYIVL